MMRLPRSEPVYNRSELRTTLENRLVAPEPELKEYPVSEEDRRSLKPKTYIIESNSKLKDLVTNGYELTPSNDPSLWNILARSSRDKSQFYLYLDMLDPRFWVVHSTYFADQTDAVMSSLVLGNSSKLDFAWFSSDTLLEISQNRVTTGFGINYTNLFASKGEGYGLSARVWGRQIPEVLRGLRKIDQIRSQLSISSVTVRNEVGVGYANEDIFRDGKLTAKGGDSIDNHFNLIDSIREHYRNLVQSIEQDYVTKYHFSERYCTLQGTYSVIEFSYFIPNLENFADVLSSGTEPFRIWGVWRKITPNLIRMQGIDQHTNTPVELELMPDELRIILKEGACGNVVPRLFTNIQARFDSNCKLRGLDSGYIIQPHQAS